MKIQYKIYTVLLITVHYFCSGVLSVNTGIGPGVYATENQLNHFNLTKPNDTIRGSSLFKSIPAPLVAFLCDGTIEPHHNSFIYGLITGGLLPNGRAFFLTKALQNGIVNIDRTPAQFNGHFFVSAYGSGGISFDVTNRTSLKMGLGYGLNVEYLNVFTTTKPSVFGRFTRQFVGPLVSLTAIYKKSPFLITGSYQGMLGTIQNTITYPAKRTNLFITMPGIMNFLNLLFTYVFNDTVNASINISYSDLFNYKKGSVSTLVQGTVESNNAFAHHYFIKLLAVYFQLGLTY